MLHHHQLKDHHFKELGAHWIKPYQKINVLLNAKNTVDKSLVHVHTANLLLAVPKGMVRREQTSNQSFDLDKFTCVPKPNYSKENL